MRLRRPHLRRPRLPRPSRRLLVVGGAVGVAGLVGAVVALRGGGSEDDDTYTAETALAAVEQRDLVVTDAYEGTLGFGEAREHVTDRAGVVTTVAAVGSTVDVGGSLFSVDFEPTVLLTGAVPAYRALDTAAGDGPDVAQLEQGLVALGHGAGVTVDDHFDDGTAAAVERWEEALGRSDPDGRVELGDVVFSGGPIRIGTVTSDVGTRVQQGSTVLEATPTDHVVTVDLDATRSNELEPGTKVGLTMPDGTETTGTVSTIGTEADEGDEEAGLMPGGPGGPTVPVTITLDDPAAAAAFDTGSVEVAIERSRDEGATAVPVTALLALVEGGYAVEVHDGDLADGGRLLPVEVGTIADGWVGISGDGIEPGLEVVVPA